MGDVTLASSFSDLTCCHRAILSPIASSLDLFYSLIILLSKYVFQIKIRICLISENLFYKPDYSTFQICFANNNENLFN